MIQPTHAGIGLVRLSDSDFVPQNPEDDLRGKDVYDPEGQRIGGVKDLYIDHREREMRFLQVSAGGFLGMGDKPLLVPVEAVVKVAEDWLTIEPCRTHKVEGPAPFGTKVAPRPQTSRPTRTPGCLTATLRAPRPPRLLVTGHPPAVLADVMREVTGLMAAETYLLPGQMALCR